MKDTDRYNDIIDLLHHRSKRHPPMPAGDRAAQFSPFASLRGYDEEIEEAARFVDDRLEADEERMAAVNEALLLLKTRESERPAVQVTFFKADARKEGGAFVTLAARLKKIDEGHRLLCTEEENIPFDDILEIEML